MIQTLIDVLTAPRDAFARLRDQPRAWLPMLLLLASVLIGQLIFLNLVDREFLIADIIETAGNEVSAEDKERMRAFRDRGGGSFAAIGVVMGVLGTLVLQSLHAAYFFLVARFAGAALAYKGWFAFVWWASVPKVLSAVAGVVAVIMAPAGKISIYETRPLSFVSLFGLRLENTNLMRLLNSFDLMSLWTLVLMMIGAQLWLQRSWWLSGAIVLAPYGLVYGVWSVAVR
ncbi:MAG: YIP1 family protein [Pseudomonadota bacterium]